MRSHERQNELIPVWDFKLAWKQVLFTWIFISPAFQNDSIFWWDICRHFISGSVYMIFYHPKWSFISVKMADMKSMRTSALNTISHDSALIHFVSSELCSRETISCRFESWIWDPYHFEFHFASIHVITSKELTEHRIEIFNRNEISYRFEVISPLMWTYSKSGGNNGSSSKSQILSYQIQESNPI